MLTRRTLLMTAPLAGLGFATQADAQLQIEFPFTLPKGYMDPSGVLHREGVMRLATAADELLPMKDPRVRANEAYAAVIILSRVITRLGDLDMITPRVIENLFATDFAFLNEFYDTINSLDGLPGNSD